MIDKKSMKRKAGRPLKYSAYLLALDNETAYCPASIVDYGIEKGLMSTQLSDPEKADLRRKMRQTFSRFARNHGFPLSGDAWVDINNHKKCGWKGIRWKEAAGFCFEGGEQ